MVTIAMTVIECYKCHMPFEVTKEFYEEKLKYRTDPDRRNFWCPAGHSQLFTGESEEQRLRRQLEAERQANLRAREEASRMAKQIQVQRGLVTRIKNRVHNGVCPECKRSFTNLRRHMQSKHAAVKKHG